MNSRIVNRCPGPNGIWAAGVTFGRQDKQYAFEERPVLQLTTERVSGSSMTYFPCDILHHRAPCRPSLHESTLSVAKIGGPNGRVFYRKG